MRRTVLFVTLAMVTCAAAVQAQTPPKPNTFATMTACTGALESGAFRFYEPRYFGLRTQNLANGEDRVIVPLESDMCLEMLVVGGRRFVVQREGTMFRARRLADGSLALYARDDCGNPVYGVVFPAPVIAPVPSPAKVVGPEPAPVWPVQGPVRGSFPQHPLSSKKKGFCSSTKCRVTLAVVGAAAAGYAVWYFRPCPPGTAHRY